MVCCLLGQTQTLISYGTLGTVLFCAGLAIGSTFGKRSAQARIVAAHDNARHLFGMLAHLVDWTRGMADDMNEYRAVMAGVSQLFTGTAEPLSERQRQDTLGLLAQVVTANEQLRDRLNQAEEMLNQQAHEITTYMSEARTDPLTGLPNRRALDEDLTYQVAQWQRHGRPWSLLMIDIDHFKQLNDTHGHQAGDAMLQQVAELLQSTMGRSDLVGRFGGEEMAVVLPNANGEQARHAAERARQAIQASVFTHGEASLRGTVSIGAAQCLGDESSAALLRRADEALYAAKQAGRNRAFWHDGRRAMAIGPASMPMASSATESPGRSECPATNPASEESFAEVCQDLRRRLQEVTAGTAP